ncbi:MAG TPA: hypothetical protein VFJ14_12755 [Nocardioidaceae bacterium]|nr:hypothetical protein [Nocardioidaceae bacterium]
MKSARIAAVTGLAALPLAFTAPASAAETVNFHLDDINDTGSTATATLTATDNGSLHVEINGTGFTPNSPHAQHIHGEVGSKEFVCPPPSADTDGDGLISTVEGVPAYGGVMVSLTTKGDTSAKSGLALDRFPVADAEGNLNYERTIPADMLPEGIVDSLQQLHIVQHGIDVNGNDKYDLEALGESPFAKSLGVNGVPAEGTFPATCGEVTPVGSVDTGAGSTGGIEQLPLMAFGGVALAGAAGTVLLRRRFTESS